MEQVASSTGKESKLIVYTEHAKPFICNSTNGAEISKAAKSPSYLAWAGAQITIGVKPDQRMRDGSKGPALIIKAGHPRTVSVAPPDYSLQAAMLRECTTIEDLGIIWKGLTREQQAALTLLKETRKGELNANK
jgi:hypothetical protein